MRTIKSYGRFLILGVLLVAVAGVPSAAALSISTIPSIRFGPLGETVPYGSGFGGRVQFGIPIGSTPLSITAGVGAYGFPPAQTGFGTAFMLIPEAGARAAWRFPLGRISLETGVELAYRHYISWHEHLGVRYITTRPIASLGVRAEFVVGKRIALGPDLRYDLIFDNSLRHVLEAGIAVTVILL